MEGGGPTGDSNGVGDFKEASKLFFEGRRFILEIHAVVTIKRPAAADPEDSLSFFLSHGVGTGELIGERDAANSSGVGIVAIHTASLRLT